MTALENLATATQDRDFMLDAIQRHRTALASDLTEQEKGLLRIKIKLAEDMLPSHEGRVEEAQAAVDAIDLANRWTDCAASWESYRPVVEQVIAHEIDLRRVASALGADQLRAELANPQHPELAVTEVEHLLRLATEPAL
jgi:hypothetical protein